MVVADSGFQTLDLFLGKGEIVGGSTEDLDRGLELLWDDIAGAQVVEGPHLGYEPGAGDDVKGGVQPAQLSHYAPGGRRVADNYRCRPGPRGTRLQKDGIVRGVAEVERLGPGDLVSYRAGFISTTAYGRSNSRAARARFLPFRP